MRNQLICRDFFGEQPGQAAQIALETVAAFLRQDPGLRVVFNVYKDLDLEIYRELLCP